MSIFIKQWYPDGVTCLEIYKDFDKYFGVINGVDIPETICYNINITEALLVEYYDKIKRNINPNKIKC